LYRTCPPGRGSGDPRASISRLGHPLAALPAPAAAFGQGERDLLRGATPGHRAVVIAGRYFLAAGVNVIEIIPLHDAAGVP
jgi:hypothetical protein